MFRLPPATLIPRAEAFQFRHFSGFGEAFPRGLQRILDRFQPRPQSQRISRSHPSTAASVESPQVIEEPQLPAPILTPPSPSALPPGAVMWTLSDFDTPREEHAASAAPFRAPTYEGLTRKVTTKAGQVARRQDLRILSGQGKTVTTSMQGAVRMSASHSLRSKPKKLLKKRAVIVTKPQLELSDELYEQIATEALENFRADRIQDPQTAMAEVLLHETGKTEEPALRLVRERVIQCLRSGVEKKQEQEIAIDKKMLRSMAARAMEKIVDQVWTLLNKSFIVDDEDPLHRRVRRRRRASRGEVEEARLFVSDGGRALCFFVVQEGRKLLVRGVKSFETLARWVPQLQ